MDSNYCKKPEVREKFEKQILEVHNKQRALHGCPPLVLDKNLCKIAQTWVVKMADKDELLQDPDTEYGENLYTYNLCAVELDGKHAAQGWYREGPKYDFKKPEEFGDAGSFTQMIWKGSKKLGVAVDLRGNKFYVVAYYDPPGNVQTQFKDNVLPPLSGKVDINF